MNDFEHELKKQPIRPVPHHWRAHILKAAGESRDKLEGEHQPWWLTLLWPSPKAWGTLAVAWGFIACLNAATSDSGGGQEQPQTAQMRVALEEKRRLQNEIEQASISLDSAPGPRSDASLGRNAG